MSQRRISSAKDEASAGGFWDLTPDQVKSYDKVRQIDARSEEARWRVQKDRIATWSAIALLSAACTICLTVLASQRDPQVTQPAWAILSSMVAGVFSYLAGKAAR